MINVTVDDRVVVAKLAALPTTVEVALKKTIYRLAADLQKYIIQRKLSAAPGFSATLLHRVTSDLARSIQLRVESSTQAGYVYSAGDVKYAAIHEYGGSVTRYGRKAGDYTVRMPQRSFMRTSLAENKEKIISSIEQTVTEALK